MTRCNWCGRDGHWSKDKLCDLCVTVGNWVRDHGREAMPPDLQKHADRLTGARR